MADNSYDFIVVGAGSAGCVLANRLSEDGSKVLVLEAGGGDDRFMIRFPLGFRKLMADPKVNWGYQSEPEPHRYDRVIPIPRGKVLGGTSSINGMLFTRGHPRDFDIWQQMGATGWSYDSVLPYYKRLETDSRGEGPFHGGSGPLNIIKHKPEKPLFEAMIAAVDKVGIPHIEDMHAEPPEGFGACEMCLADGRRASAAQAFLHPAMSRPNLTVETRAQATRVVIENGRAVGIEYLQNGQARTARATRDVVLSGGSYNSPQLLMLSGIGPADELKALGIEPVLDLPGVGKNLQDHFTVMVEHKRKPVFPFDKLLRFDRMALAVMRWTLFRDGPATQFPAIGDAYYRTRPELEVPDIQFMFRIVSLDTRLWFPGVAAPALRKFNTRAICLHPESRGAVTLRSADPLAPPRIFFNAASEKKDVETLRTGIRTIREIFAQSPLAEMTDGEVMPGPAAQSDDEVDAYILKATGTSQHPVSTCRMGNDDMAVVGSDLKVRGIEGLRVADASVMPTEPTGAPNALVIMIGEKASDLILGRAPLPRAEI